jgi:uncharacterized lipoprotein YbaY
MKETAMRVLLCLLLMFCVSALAEDRPAKEKPKVSGSVEFKDKVKFEEGTKVTIQVQDTSIADKKAEVLGEKVINPKKTPIEFEIEYDGSKIKPRGRYTISCRITDKDGKLLFINDTSIPVITDKDRRTKDVKVPVIPVKR